MHRRKFLKGTLSGAVAVAAAQTSGIALAQNLPTSRGPEKPSQQREPDFSKLRGVNLGAWLVLEKWMVPDVYRGTDAPDEYSLCLELGEQARSRLERHRETFITAEDFRWIRDCG